MADNMRDSVGAPLVRGTGRFKASIKTKESIGDDCTCVSDGYRLQETIKLHRR